MYTPIDNLICSTKNSRIIQNKQRKIHRLIGLNQTTPAARNLRNKKYLPPTTKYPSKYVSDKQPFLLLLISPIYPSSNPETTGRSNKMGERSF